MVGHGVSVTLISWTCCEKGQKRRRWWSLGGYLLRKRAETSQVVVFRGVPAAKRGRNVAGGLELSWVARGMRRTRVRRKGVAAKYLSDRLIA